MKYSEYDSNSIEEINNLFIKTFTDSEGGAEGLIIGELTNNYMTNTNAEDFDCFVATDNGKIIAAVFFTKLTFESSDINAYILSPMATLTEYQGKGIGQKLISYAHGILKKKGVEIVVTYGDINFYSKIGYKHITEDVVPAPLKLSYPEGWLGQSFISNKIDAIVGKSYCVDALNKASLW